MNRQIESKKLVRSDGSIKSRIPISSKNSVSSRIPVMTKKVQTGVVEKAANKNVNVIKPVITKRKSPEFKNFKFKNCGTKVVVKKSDVPLQKNNIGKISKQMTIPDNYFAVTRTLQPSIKLSDSFLVPEKCLILQTTPDKENSFSQKDDSEVENKLPNMSSKISEQLKMQQSLNIAFQPNEFSLNQILNNRVLTPAQSFASPLSISEKKRRVLRLKNLEEARKLSITKALRKQSLIGDESCSMKKYTSESPFSERRCTWASGGSTKAESEAVDIYASTMAAIKRKSAVKKCLSYGPSSLDGKNLSSQGKMVSPYKLSASTLKASDLTPYEYAMACLKKRADKHRASSTVSSSIKSDSNLRNSLTQDYVKAIDVEDIRKRIEALATCEITNRTPSPKLSEVVSNVKPVEFNAEKTVYRPLKLRMNGTCGEKEKRLTDISEHSETDATRSLTNSFCDPLPETLPLSRNLTDSLHYTGSSGIVAVTTWGRDTMTYSSPALKKFPPGHIHTPRPIESLKRSVDPLFFHSEFGTTVMSCTAPICTPLVLANMARRNEEDLSPLRVKLNFDNAEDGKKKRAEPELDMLFERRCSVSTDHIITKARREEMLADKECAEILAACNFLFHQSRKLLNPVAKVLEFGDSMHFVPIMEE